MKFVFTKICQAILVTLVFCNCFTANAKTNIDTSFIESQIIKLILRLDSLNSNVVYDRDLISHYSKYNMNNEDLSVMFKSAEVVITKNHMKIVDIDKDALSRKIPVNILQKYIPTPIELAVENCVYKDDFFSRQMDSLPSLSSSNLNNDREYDSIYNIILLGMESVVTKLAEKRCSSFVKKQFVLFDVYEGQKFYIILYGLKVENNPDLFRYSEIVFKPQ
jgi:hypothetical protein